MQPLEQYAERFSSAPPSIICMAEQASDAYTKEWSLVRSSRLQTQFLATLARAIDARVIVEVGTFTGYTTLALALACPLSEVQTFDSSPTFMEFAEGLWDRAGVQNIRAYVGDARLTLPTLAPDAVDFAFIDANKEDYLTYYEVLMKKMRPNGLLAIDDTLWFGEVLYPESPMCRGIQAVNAIVRSDPRVEATIMTYRNGLTICRKREEKEYV